MPPCVTWGHRGGGSLSLPTQASGRGSRPSASHARLTTDTRCRRVRGNLECHSYSLAWHGIWCTCHLPLAKAVHVVEPRVGWGVGSAPRRLCKSQAVGRDVELWSHLCGGGGDDRDYDLILWHMHFQKVNHVFPSSQKILGMMSLLCLFHGLGSSLLT